MSDKEKVLRVLPGAIAVYHATGYNAGRWTIEDREIFGNVYTNSTRTENAAWTSAAANLPKKGKRNA